LTAANRAPTTAANRPLRLPSAREAWRMGTTSSDFVNATLTQIQNASRLPGGGISETSVNAVLAFIEGAEPKNEIEAALAIQMACTHAVTMAVLSHLGGAFGPSRNTAMMVAAVAKLGRAFAAQVEGPSQAEKRWIAVRSS
jgi:hypothetical protein